jgi:hypothetical protein
MNLLALEVAKSLLVKALLALGGILLGYLLGALHERKARRALEASHQRMQRGFLELMKRVNEIREAQWIAEGKPQTQGRQKSPARAAWDRVRRELWDIAAAQQVVKRESA